MSPEEPVDKNITELENEVKLLKRVLEKALPSYLERAKKDEKKQPRPTPEEKPASQG